MKANRVYLLSLLFIVLSCLLFSACARKSGCPGIDKTINKKIKKKDKSQLFGKGTRKRMG